MTDQLYIWVNRWEDFQTYHKKRGKPWAPPWIRNHTRLLRNPNYLKLTARQRGILHGLWLLMADARLELGSSPAQVGQMLGEPTVRARDLEALNHAGFIAFCSRTVLEEKWNTFWNSSTLEVEVEVDNPPTPLNGTQPRPRRQTYLDCPHPNCRLSFKTDHALALHIQNVHDGPPVPLTDIELTA